MLRELTILVIHHRTPELLAECLDRLARFAAGARVVVIDSGPAEEVAALRRRVEVEVIGVPNHSLAHAVNRGLKLVETPFVAHLNADVLVASTTFPTLLAALAPAHVGMVGPRARTRAGTPQRQGVPYERFYRRLGRTESESIPVPWLSGCLQLLKREAVRRVGGMDASLRFYNEDVEWCWRLSRAGLSCHLVGTDVLHLGGASTPKDPRFLVEGYRGGYKLSQRYKPNSYRALHRATVLAQSAWNRRFARSAVQRDAFRQIYEMFRRGAFDESPFGETLNEANPRFLATAAAP